MIIQNKLPRYITKKIRERTAEENCALFLALIAFVLCVLAITTQSIPIAIIGVTSWWGVGSIYKEIEDKIGPSCKYVLDE